MNAARRLRATGGTPIEEAPLWALALLALLLAIVFFPALVGLAESFGRDTRGDRVELAVAAAAVALLLVAGLARQTPWRRARTALEPERRPLFVRFSTWLWVALLFPNVLHGLLVLTRDPAEPRIGPHAAWLVGFGVSTIQGAWSLIDRRRRRRSRYQEERSLLSKPSANSGTAGRKAE